MRVEELERKLLADFPAGQAEAWDRTGMLVGDPDDEVRTVLVALDPTRGAVAQACDVGANVLVTHHPMFLDPPEQVMPAARGRDVVGSRIWEAISRGVSVMSFHTALDASPLAADALAAPLGLVPDGGLLEELPGAPGCGYGRLCSAGGIALGELAGRCRAAFGHEVRVWGEPGRALGRVCLWTGAAGQSPRECNALGIDALVCGEVKYHEALDASEAGLCLIELGHDVSEQVLCSVLVESLKRVGLPPECIHLRELPANWR